MSRYNVSKTEDFEPGSNEQVLKNFLGIQSKDTMDQLEAQELKRTELLALEMYNENYQFTAKDICHLHKLWLEKIYSFAGHYRSVNMSKGDFPFAGANYILPAMKIFEEKYLAKYTPCNEPDLDKLSYALGVVHVEFIVIHPFREGNGRIGRLLAVLMALQAGLPPLSFADIDQTINPEGFNYYIHAIQAGDYKFMQAIFKQILVNSIKTSSV